MRRRGIEMYIEIDEAPRTPSTSRSFHTATSACSAKSMGGKYEDDTISEASTTCTVEDEAHALQPLLWVSELSFSGAKADEFALTIGRSCRKQRFGLTFHAHDITGEIVIAEDAMQFGILKGDVVLSINGVHELTVERFQRILHSSLYIELSLRRADFDKKTYCAEALAGQLDWKTLSTTRHGCKCIDLLSVSPQEPVSDGRGNRFTITISRATRNQKFGLNLNSIKCHTVDGKTEIYCAEDAKHLGLRDGDQILRLNDCTVSSVDDCQEILDKRLSVEVLVERQSKILDRLH